LPIVARRFLFPLIAFSLSLFSLSALSLVQTNSKNKHARITEKSNLSLFLQREKEIERK
jgi:hypothetical protein